MMRRIIISCMRIRLVIVGIALLLLFFGITQLTKMPIDALPEFSRPYVEIQTEALGLSAAEVEALITTPLEADMLNGISWVEEIRSESIPGLSSIVLIFEAGTDIMNARQMVQERLVSVYFLPNVSKPPAMLNPLSSASRCMMIGLTSEEMSLIDMSVLARWTIVPRLMGVPGVANVSIWGQRKRQLQVLVDPKNLQNSGVTLNQIISTTGNALWVSPLSFLESSTPGTGGWIDTPNQRLGIRHILPISTAEDLSQVIIEGSNLHIGDVSDVVEQHQPLIGDAIVDESPNLMLIVEKFPWANTIDVTENVEKALSSLRHGLTGLNMDSSLFRPATFLEIALHNITQAIIIGAILILLTVFTFLFNWRFTLIASVSILLSAIVAVGVLYLSGVTLNMMIIAGLLMALAVLIDDVIIDVDNMKRRLVEHQEKSSDKTKVSIIYESLLEIRSPAIYAVFVLVLVAIPVFVLNSISGAFYKPIATSYILAIISSFVISLVFTPVLSFLFFRKSIVKNESSTISKFLERIYNRVFMWATSKIRLVFVGVCIIVVATIISSLSFKQESIIPSFNETDLLVRWDAPEGTSHPEMKRIAGIVTKELQSVQGVLNVSANVGRAVLSDRITNMNYSQIWVSIDPGADYESTVSAVEDVVSGYPGLSNEVITYLESKIREELSGTEESIVMRIYGEDLDIIKEKADEVKELFVKIDGVENSKVLYPKVKPTVEIEVDLELAKRYGLKPGDVRRATTSLVGGIEVGYLFEEQKVFDVVVWGTPETRHSLTSLKQLYINTPRGDQVQLKDVADIRIVPAVTNIKREGVARYMDVVANVSGRGLIDVADEIENKIEEIDFPLEYRAELLGEFAEHLEAHERVISFIIAAAILIFLLLQAVFRSWKMALASFFTFPAALIGGVIIIFLSSGNIISLGSILGFVVVYGLTARYSIILIKRYQSIEKDGTATFGPDLVKQVTSDRFNPIFITSFVTIMGFLPMALYGNVAGMEILHSMALVIIGGMVTSVLYLTLAVPAMYLMFGAVKEPELDFVVDDLVSEGSGI